MNDVVVAAVPGGEILKKPLPTRGDLKSRLIDFANELGFESCRIAACNPPAHTREFHDWLRNGSHGEMEYMARGEKKRSNPDEVLPGAKSIVVLALNYFQGVEAGVSPAMENATGAAAIKTGRFARYAWGDDYHDVISSKLDKIDNFLREFGGTQKCYVDTGPILERDHAATAGVGWHGKSTMLIDEKLGTWFFLAEILTTLELPPDAPVAGPLWKMPALYHRMSHRRNHCASQTRCASLHFLSHDRIKRSDSGRTAAADGRSHFWM